MMVKYMPTLSCLHEADHLHQHFVSCLHGRDEWVQLEQTGIEQVEGKDAILYGYIGLAHDLDKVDVDFHRRCLIRSRKQINAIASDGAPT
jgi:hypothetical protein